MSKQKLGEITMPEGYELLGIFKLKDKEGKRAIKLNVKGDVREVVIQKFTGENNKIIVAIKRGEYEYGAVITPKETGIVGADGKKIKTSS